MAYFINPNEKHGCGEFLLKKLLAVLDAAIGEQVGFFQDVGCEVYCETDHIDLRIMQRSTAARKFAIIIENKVNGAPNQLQQLRRYAECLLREYRYRPDEVFVFYLPLTNDERPNKHDEDWLKENGVLCAKITFETQIRDWLDASLKGWPPGHPEMREHVSYYRSLIAYLNEKQKQQKMNAEILKQLENAGEDKLPRLSHVENLRKSTNELENCLQMIIRGKLILETQKILRAKGFKTFLCDEDRPQVEIHVSSMYDPCFQKSIDLCVRIGTAVRAAFGGGTGGLWFGFMRDGLSQEQGKITKIVTDQAKLRSKELVTDHPAWYAYWWHWQEAKTPYDYCESHSEDLAESFAETIIKMCRSLQEHLPKSGTKE